MRTRIGKAAVKAVPPVRHASVTAGPPSATAPGPVVPETVEERDAEEAGDCASSELGQRIYVFNHFLKNHVVYSLRKNIRNVHAMRQIPFNGKKTKPPALRKDHWRPLAMIEFSPASSTARAAGITAFHKLREYRKLHETAWPDSFAKDEAGKTLSRVERGRKLCDQKANSIADMAAALKHVTGIVVPKIKSPNERKRGKRLAELHRKPGPEELISATVRWTDMFDAEYAAEWPKDVVHDVWPVTSRFEELDTFGEKAPLPISASDEVAATKS